MQVAELSIKTLLAVLIANDQENLITLAFKEDMGLNTLPYKVNDIIPVECHKDDALLVLKENERFDTTSSWIILELPIVAINPLVVTSKYCVMLPNGKGKWVEPSTSRITRIVPSVIQAVEAVR